jgi:hypothetical protein
MSDADEGTLGHSDGGEGQELLSSPLPERGKAEIPSQPQGSIARDELLSKARMFLASPAIQSQDLDAKRTFLGEKGLSEHEVEDLLRTLVRTTFSIDLYFL